MKVEVADGTILHIDNAATIQNDGVTTRFDNFTVYDTLYFGNLLVKPNFLGSLFDNIN